MDMQRGFYLCSFLFLVFIVLTLPSQRVMAQGSQDDQPHIQPGTLPVPTPTPKANKQQPKSQDSQDQYDRPPFPGDAPGTPAASKPTNGKSSDGYERPSFPGEDTSTNPDGSSATGESSSRDSLIDLNAKSPKDEPAPTKEDESVLKPWDPHKAAKDVEVGEYYLKLKNYRAALERFNHALTYKPDDAEATYDLAVTQEKLELLSLADQSYHKYLQILPNGPKARDAEEALKRINSQSVARVSAGATGDSAKTAVHDLNVGETYLAGNHFDAARERFEEAMRLAPDNSLVYFRLGQALQGMQQLDPARLYYRKYLELEPKGKFAGNAKKAISQIDWILGK
jgi:Flp pilus assembly protein TadD